MEKNPGNVSIDIHDRIKKLDSLKRILLKSKICEKNKKLLLDYVKHRDVKYPGLEFESNDKLLVILPYNIYNEKELLIKKEDWIWKKLKVIRHHLEKFKKYEKEIRNKNLIFGKFYGIVYSKGKYNIRINKSKIEISAPSKNSAVVYLKKWLKKQLLNKIVSYLNKFSSELDIKYNSVFIRTQKTKWASCSSRSNLSFNIKIASLPEELIEYAVCMKQSI